MKFGVGQAVMRVEDQRFLTGTGQYTDDVSLPNQAHVHILRSPHAHAEIKRLDVAAARAAPGVLGVLTGEDAKTDGLGLLPCRVKLNNRDGSPGYIPPYPVLAQGRVRYVGEEIAAVVAESLDQARDAAELIAIDYDQLPAAVGTDRAVLKKTPRLWADAPDNVCLDWEIGDEKATEDAFVRAARVVAVDVVNSRIVVNAMEPRAALGAYDSSTRNFTLYAQTQGPHAIRRPAASVLQAPQDSFRVVTPDVGGGFGMKASLYTEYVIVLWAARKVGRPVKWTSDRSSAFLSDAHGRDKVIRAELALDADNRTIGLRIDALSNMGAYLTEYGPGTATVPGGGLRTGVYAIPAAYARVRAVMTNSVPVNAYRGVNSSECCYAIERVIDAAAREVDMDPAAFRLLNHIPPEAMPYETQMGHTYDRGNFAQATREALRIASWDSFAERRAEAKARGKMRGIGVAYFIESRAGPVAGGENCELRFEPDESVTLLIGGKQSGQGHETAFAQMIAEFLGVPFERITVREGDTDDLPEGGVTGGVRSMVICGGAIRGAADEIIRQGGEIAAERLEAAASDIEFSEGHFKVAGTDRRMSLFEAAATVRETKGNGATPLSGSGAYVPESHSYPNGCHICEVEIDPDTGAMEIATFTAVNDFGNVVNPLLLTGQVHGGVAQGIGQAAMEQTVYDVESGQLVTGSFMDYALPRAADVPDIASSWEGVPCRNNSSGRKGAGEAGAVGSTPAVINAVINALSELGVTHFDMPATPDRIWQAIREAQS